MRARPLRLVTLAAGALVLAALSTGCSPDNQIGPGAQADAGATSDGATSDGATSDGAPVNTNPVLNLDSTGKTIPDTNYPIPSDAVYMAPDGKDTNPGTKAAPVLTLNKAVSVVPSSGTIVLRAGTYRDWYNNGSDGHKIMTKPVTIQAYPHEQAWFDGTDVQPASGWKSEGNGQWSMAWNTPSFCDGNYYDFPYNHQASPGNLTGASGATYKSNQGPCTHYDQYGPDEATYPAAGDPQMVFVDGERMEEVASLASATGGKFFYDMPTKRIYISTDPQGRTVELAARPVAMVLGSASAGYTLRGIGFRRYASNEYSNLTGAAVYIGGSHPAVLENVVFTQNAAIGLSINAPRSSINLSVFAFNGFNGAGAYGHAHTTKERDDFVLENSIFNNNNLEHFGIKCSLSCAAAGIKMAAMIGYSLKNNIFANGLEKSTGAWCDTDCFEGVFVNNLSINNDVGYHYEQNDGGIIASNVFVGNKYGVNVGATNTKIYNNTFVDNRTINIRVYDDNRELLTGEIAVVNNVVYGKSVNDNYFGSGSGSTESEPSTWFTSFDYNSYHRPTSFVLYRMIGAQDDHYNSSESYNAAFPNWEANAQDLVGGSDPFFVDVEAGDYNIRSDSVAYQSGTAIPADVSAALGIDTSSGLNRGAISWPGK